MSGLKSWFDEHGWAAADGEGFNWNLSALTRHFDDVLNGKYETGVGPFGMQSFGGQLCKVSNAWRADNVIRQAVHHPLIAQIAREMLGVDELYLWADSLYWKPPRAFADQSIVGWHQDKQYWQTSSTDKMITACIALYDANALSGGLRFADGSHRWGLRGGTDALPGTDNAGAHIRPSVPEGQQWVEVCPDLKAGGVTFHHCLTYHCSGPNVTEKPRRSITIHMVAGEGRLVNWAPVYDGHLSTVGLGNPFRGPLFPRLA